MKFSDFEYLAPTTPEEVVAILKQYPGEAKILSGGQSLLSTMAFRFAQPRYLVDLRNVAGLGNIDASADEIRIGARTRWCEVESSAVLRQHHPLLQEAITHVAHYQIRNRGTVGGSLAHADPASEFPCIVATSDARVRVLGPDGERFVDAKDFLLGPLTTSLQDDEMIVAIHFPPWHPSRKWAFSEFARRPGDFALAGVALFYDPDADGTVRNAHIGVVGACQHAMRLAEAEAALDGKRIDQDTARRVAQTAAREVDPGDDFHATAEYRRALVHTLLERALLQAAGR